MREDIQITHTLKQNGAEYGEECFDVAVPPEIVVIDDFVFRFQQEQQAGYLITYELWFPIASHHQLVALDPKTTQHKYPDGLAWMAMDTREGLSHWITIRWRLDTQEWQIKLESMTASVDLKRAHLSHDLLKTIFLWTRDVHQRHQRKLEEFYAWISHRMEDGEVLSAQRPFTLWDWREQGFRTNPSVEAESQKRLQLWTSTSEATPSGTERSNAWADIWLKP